MRTEFFALCGVQGLLKQRAENSGLDQFPILPRSLVEFADFLARQGKHRTGLEQIAIELPHVPLDGVGEAALVHRLPKLPDKTREKFRLIFASLENLAKTVLRQQFHVLGEHGEKAAHEKQRDGFGVVELLAILTLGVFEVFGNFCQPLRDLTRGLGGDLGWVEFLRVEPYQAQPLANLLLPEFFEINTKPLPVGKLGVIFPLAGEVGINLKTMADIANNEERGPALGHGQRLGVLLRLLARVQHENVPRAGSGAPAKRSGLFWLGIEKAALRGLLRPRPAALLGLKDKRAALIKIDASARGRTVRFAKGNGALERISV
jgi:hypothetical protein